MTLPLLIALLAAQAPPVTRDQAMTMPPEELADIVLRQLGERVTSVTRPNFAADTDMQMVSALQDLTFATAPRATDTIGLCEADRIEVAFEFPGTDSNRAETPVRARRVRAMQVYKVVGEIEPDAEVSEARQAVENARCAGAGTVVPANYNDRARANFFAFQGADSPVTSLLVLQQAIQQARAGTYSDIACGGRPEQCRNTSETFGRLDLANLLSISVTPSTDGMPRGRHRIAASFLIDGNEYGMSYWELSIEADISQTGRDSIRLGHSELNRWDMTAG